VERHLIGCPGCRHHLESLRDAVEVLHEAAAAEIVTAPTLWPALERQIRESRRPAPSAWPRRLLWSGAAVAASVLVALAVHVARRPVSRTHPTVAATAPATPPVVTIPMNPASKVAQNEPRRRRSRYEGGGVSILSRPSAPNAH
jgi:anti-sigma factor RsiW